MVPAVTLLKKSLSVNDSVIDNFVTGNFLPPNLIP